MPKYFSILLLAVLLVLIFFVIFAFPKDLFRRKTAIKQEKDIAERELAKVVRVVDGDTIKIVSSNTGEEFTIRLIGIDTPEVASSVTEEACWGREASVWLKAQAEGKEVYLEPDQYSADMDKYGRWLRYVTIANEDNSLNYQIVSTGNGFAYLNYKFTKVDEYSTAESIARQQGLGLWDSTKCSYIK